MDGKSITLVVGGIFPLSSTLLRGVVTGAVAKVNCSDDDATEVSAVTPLGEVGDGRAVVAGEGDGLDRRLSSWGRRWSPGRLRRPLRRGVVNGLTSALADRGDVRMGSVAVTNGGGSDVPMGPDVVMAVIGRLGEICFMIPHTKNTPFLFN